MDAQKELVRTLDEATTKLDDTLAVLNLLHADFNRRLEKLEMEPFKIVGKADALLAIKNGKDLLFKLQDERIIDPITPYESGTPIFIRY